MFGLAAKAIIEKSFVSKGGIEGDFFWYDRNSQKLDFPLLYNASRYMISR
jgi:hypothetical protein